MCRFNPNIIADENNYEVVEGNIIELCEKAGRQLGEMNKPVMTGLTHSSSSSPHTHISDMPSVPRGGFRGSQDDDDLAKRLHGLVG